MEETVMSEVTVTVGPDKAGGAYPTQPFLAIHGLKSMFPLLPKTIAWFGQSAPSTTTLG